MKTDSPARTTPESDSTHGRLAEKEVDDLLRAAFRPPDEGSPERASEIALRGGFERERSEYRIVGEIARGGMGVVLRVRDDDLRRELAVKVLREGIAEDEATLARFVEEAQIGGQLQHPGIVPVYELGRMADRRPYFAMKLIRGRTLAALLAERASPDEDPHRFVAIFDQVCQAMAYAHSRGVVHRDLKPGNVMIGSFGEVQVVDWGLAKVLGDRGADARPAGAPAKTPAGDPAVTTLRSGRSTSHSIAGAVMGTPAYMPPEQARGEVHRVDERADVFALGAILCEILIGRSPYRGGDEQTADAALARTRERLATSRGAAELADLCMRCLSPDPEARPRSAAELASAVGAYRSSIEARARAAQIEAAEARVRAAAERRARRLTVALGGAVVVLAGAGIGVRLWIREQASARRARTAELVNGALDRATLAFGQASSSTDPAPWEEASAAITRARNLLDGGDPSEDLDRRTKDLADRIRTGADAARRQAALEASNRDLVARLSALRTPDDWGIDPTVWTRMDADYASAFREYGLEIDGRPTEDVARAIRERGIGLEVALGLDEWAVARARAGRTKDAERIVQIAVAADPDETRTCVRTAVLEGNADRLVECSRRARLDSLPIATLSLLGIALEEAGVHDEAFRVVHAALDQRPDDYVANIYLARLLWASDYDAAARCYATALASRPGDVAAMQEYGWLLDHYLLEPSRAIELYRRALEKRPDDSSLHLYLGHALMNLGDLDAAIAAYSDTLRLEPGRQTARLRMVECLLEKGDLEGVIRNCRELPLNLHGCESAHSCLGQALLRRGDVTGAVAELRLATDTPEAVASNGIALCTALEASGDVEGAFEASRSTVAQGPESILGFFDRGFDVEEMLDVDTAIERERAEIRLFPASPSRHAMLGVMLQSKGRCAEALFELRAADELGAELRSWALPGENDFLHARELILRDGKSKRWVAEAERQAQLAEKLDRVARGDDRPGDPAEAVELARIALRLDREAEAARLFQGALEGGAEPERVDSPSPRSEAAAAAAFLGCGRAKTPVSIPDTERAQWRARAAAWMRTDLDALAASSTNLEISKRVLSVRTIGRWRRDRRLACVREPEAIAELPADEQVTWKALWARLDEVARSTRESAGSRTK